MIFARAAILIRALVNIQLLIVYVFLTGNKYNL